ncbi:MAG: carboxypeptidase regulatory-like domain-containing protein [Acidobacteria bacterium]|nr:carboxypeptidase regulatory-like domain-containing protein [Acidobacteriota bacterium]
MQSAANFKEAILIYNSAIMWFRCRSLAVALTLALAAGAGPAAQDRPAPAPEAPPVRQVVGTITGTVHDGLKKPIVGCMVQLTSRGQDGMLRVTGSDEKGHYVFKDLPAGTYDIEVGTAEDLTRRKERIEVKPPFRNIVDFEIGPRTEGQGRQDLSTALLTEALKKAAAGRPGPGGAAAPADPAGTVPVRGTFVDARKRPIPEVSVMLLSLEGKGTFQDFSGMDGTFSLPAVPPGRYRVLVASPGYVSIDLKAVDVSPAKGLNLSLSLVDYPLNFKGRTEDRLPPEEPLPVPSESRPESR